MTLPGTADPRSGFHTPTPTYTPADPVSPQPAGVGAPMDHHERSQIRAAAFRAQKVYPGPVGVLLCRELLAWDEFGRRLDRAGLVMKVVHQVMTAELPAA